MKACIVTPFHDMRWRDNALANVKRTGLPAVFVLNQGARGSVDWPVATVECEDNQASGINLGVEWARRNGFDAVLSYDSDDYYGPSYAQKTLAELSGVAIVGRKRVFAQLKDGIHLFNRPGRPFLFATVAFKLHGFLPVRNILDSCGDWCARMAGEGATLKELTPVGYCYRRHEGNAHWQLPIEGFVRAAWGSSLFFGELPVECVDDPPPPRGMKQPPTLHELHAELSAIR